MESQGSQIDFSKLTAALTGEPSALRQTASMPVSNLDSMEEQMIIKALERTGGQRTLAAEQLGISRRTLSRKLKEYNINFAPGDGTAALWHLASGRELLRVGLGTPLISVSLIASGRRLIVGDSRGCVRALEIVLP